MKTLKELELAKKKLEQNIYNSIIDFNKEFPNVIAEISINNIFDKTEHTNRKINIGVSIDISLVI